MRIIFIIFTLFKFTLGLSQSHLFLKKASSITKLIRPQNIVPTIALNVAGGYIMNPSLIGLLKNPAFVSSVLITQSVMASSMVLNDVYDLPIDRINNPARPLIAGEVSVLTAKRLAVGLLVFVEILNVRFIPRGLKYISRLSSLFAILYTPFLKRAVVLKNAACAVLVASSVLFSGFTVSPDIVIGPNFKLLMIATKFIFMGSFTSEILLDISDEMGDRINGLKTLPIMVGNNRAWDLAYMSMYMNILVNALDLLRTFGPWPATGFIIICGPALDWIRDIRYHEYSRRLIKEYGKKIIGPMGLVLIYLGGLSKYMSIV
jgi:geranylgeranylglycerol-phosphate geranylgeranyltransferase